MSGLNSLSDAELLALYNKPDLSSMSDADLMKAYGAAPKEEPGSSLGGVAKSLGVGAAEGLIGLAGLLGDVSVIGIPNNPESPYGSAAIKKAIEDKTGEFYKPQGTAENLANKVGQFAPAAIGGPGSMAARVATRVAIPAAASEVGKEVAGPYGEVAGALTGAAAASAAARKFQQMGAARKALPTGPSAEEHLKTASGQFKSAEDMGLTVTPDFAPNAATKMRADLKGFDPEAQSVVFKAADRLENLGSSKAPALSQTQRLELEMNGRPLPTAQPLPVSMNDVELIRKQLVTMKTDINPSVREAARKAIASLQESQLAITPAQVIRGNADEYTKLMSDAIGNWKYGKQSNTLMGKAALGDLNSATAGSGANDDNALRQAFKQLSRPVNNDITPKWQRLGFDKDVGAAIDRVSRGSAAGNAARYVGKLAPTGSVSGVLSAGAGYGAAGPLGAVALPAVGYLAKKIGDLSTKRAVAAVDSLVRSRSPLAAQVAAQLPPQVIQQLPPKTQRLLQTLILADPVLNQQPRQAVGQPAAQ
jgi:hypothetical protein